MYTLRHNTIYTLYYWRRQIPIPEYVFGLFSTCTFGFQVESRGANGDCWKGINPSSLLSTLLVTFYLDKKEAWNTIYLHHRHTNTAFYGETRHKD